MATQATLEQCNSGEDRGHSGAGDGMEPAFFLGGGELEHLRGKLVTCPCSQPEDAGRET